MGSALQYLSTNENAINAAMPRMSGTSDCAELQAYWMPPHVSAIVKETDPPTTTQPPLNVISVSARRH